MKRKPDILAMIKIDWTLKDLRVTLFFSCYIIKYLKLKKFAVNSYYMISPPIVNNFLYYFEKSYDCYN
jgi:hypothetical protein